MNKRIFHGTWATRSPTAFNTASTLSNAEALGSTLIEPLSTVARDDRRLEDRDSGWKRWTQALRLSRAYSAFLENSLPSATATAAGDVEAYALK